MNGVLASAQRSLIAGLLIALLMLGLWIAATGVDSLGLVSFLLRWIHILSAMLWVGMIFFVNFIQFAALQKADEAGRATIMSSIVPPVAKSFMHASGLTVVSGVLLLIPSGYLFDNLVFASAVYIPPPRNLLLWSGVAGGLVMFGFVHFLIWPNLRIVLNEAKTDAAAVARAREKVRTYARLNLVLALPVTFAMVAAAHLY